MTALDLRALVPEIKRWLKDHGCEFVAEIPIAIVYREPEDGSPTEPSAKIAEHRSVFISDDQDTVDQLNGRWQYSYGALANRWQEGLRRAVADAERVLVRTIAYHAPDDFCTQASKEYIRIRLCVVVKSPAVSP